MRGAREPVWAPDGRRLALSYLDRIWVVAPDGRNGRALRPGQAGAERDPAWSPDGKSIAFAADAGDGFNLVTVAADGSRPQPLTTMAGDERWPSWTGDGRIVFSHRAGGRWRLYVISANGGEARPLFPDTADDDESQGRVSPDGRRVAYVSDRESDDGEADLWVADLVLGPRDRVARTRLVRARGLEGHPSWAPDGARLAYFAVRDGVGSVWVVGAEAETALIPVVTPYPRRGLVRPRHRCWSRAAAASLPGHPTGSASPSRSCRRPIRPTTATPPATTTSRRRSLPTRKRSGCGPSMRRCRSTPARAKSSASAPATAND